MVREADAFDKNTATRRALSPFPSAPVFSREVRRDATVGDLELTRGDRVVVQIYVVHRHRKLWTDPDRFSPEASAERHRYSFLPFGAGPLTCIGMNFAISESVVILAALLRRFRLDLAPGIDPEVTVKITLRPRQVTRMSLAHRGRRGQAGVVSAVSG